MNAIGAGDFDLRTLPDSFFADPYPTYRALHEQAPVLALPDGGFFLTGHQIAREVYRDHHRFSSDKRTQFAPVFGAESPLYEHHTTSLVFNDPPLHTQVRKAIGNALSGKIVAALSDDLQMLVAGLLDQAQERGKFDLIADFAAAIPVEIIGNLLKIPASERQPLRNWSLAILGALEVNPDDAQLREGNSAVTRFVDYLEQLINTRAAHLADDEDDILARLMRYSGNDRQLTRTELYHQCIFLLNAGHETTTNLIGNAVQLLLERPEAVARLRAEPGLIEPAIEEVLRMESPNQLGNRTTTQAFEIGGVHIPANRVLTLCIGAANRDPTAFDRPDTFVIDRTPNLHLAFGAGIHTCAGLNVARLEARVAVAAILARFPGLHFTSEPVRARRARFRGFVTAPVAIR